MCHHLPPGRFGPHRVRRRRRPQRCVTKEGVSSRRGDCGGGRRRVVVRGGDAVVVDGVVWCDGGRDRCAVSPRATTTAQRLSASCARPTTGDVRSVRLLVCAVRIHTPRVGARARRRRRVEREQRRERRRAADARGARRACDMDRERDGAHARGHAALRQLRLAGRRLSGSPKVCGVVLFSRPAGAAPLRGALVVAIVYLPGGEGSGRSSPFVVALSRARCPARSRRLRSSRREISTP